MQERKILWIVIIVLCGFTALSYVSGFLFFNQVHGKIDDLGASNQIQLREMASVKKNINMFSSELRKINKKVADSVREVAFLENKVENSASERETILSKLNGIGADLENLQNTYAEYVGKLDEMGTILESNASADPRAAKNEEFVQDIDLGDISVEGEGDFDAFAPADLIEQ